MCGSAEAFDHLGADLSPRESLKNWNDVSDEPSHCFAIHVSAKCDAALSIGEAVSDQVEEVEPVVDMNERVGSSEDTTKTALNGTSVRNNRDGVVHIVGIVGIVGVLLIHCVLKIAVGSGLRSGLDV